MTDILGKAARAKAKEKADRLDELFKEKIRRAACDVKELKTLRRFVEDSEDPFLIDRARKTFDRLGETPFGKKVADAVLSDDAGDPLFVAEDLSFLFVPEILDGLRTDVLKHSGHDARYAALFPAKNGVEAMFSVGYSRASAIAEELASREPFGETADAVLAAAGNKKGSETSPLFVYLGHLIRSKQRIKDAGGNVSEAELERIVLSASEASNDAISAKSFAAALREANAIIPDAIETCLEKILREYPETAYEYLFKFDRRNPMSERCANLFARYAGTKEIRSGVAAKIGESAMDEDGFSGASSGVFPEVLERGIFEAAFEEAKIGKSTSPLTDFASAARWKSYPDEYFDAALDISPTAETVVALFSSGTVSKRVSHDRMLRAVEIAAKAGTGREAAVVAAYVEPFLGKEEAVKRIFKVALKKDPSAVATAFMNVSASGEKTDAIFSAFPRLRPSVAVSFLLKKRERIDPGDSVGIAAAEYLLSLGDKKYVADKIWDATYVRSRIPGLKSRALAAALEAPEGTRRLNMLKNAYREVSSVSAAAEEKLAEELTKSCRLLESSRPDEIIAVVSEASMFATEAVASAERYAVSAKAGFLNPLTDADPETPETFMDPSDPPGKRGREIFPSETARLFEKYPESFKNERSAAALAYAAACGIMDPNVAIGAKGFDVYERSPMHCGQLLNGMLGFRNVDTKAFFHIAGRLTGAVEDKYREELIEKVLKISLEDPEFEYPEDETARKFFFESEVSVKNEKLRERIGIKIALRNAIEKISTKEEDSEPWI